MLQWWWNNKLWYAKADATATGPVCYAGQPTAVFSPSSGNGKLAIYFGGTPATCRIDAPTNSLVIEVPASAVGAPAAGETFHEVTAYSFLFDVPGTLMNQVDATNPFTYAVGK